jgi:hypothetical protein
MILVIGVYTRGGVFMKLIIDRFEGEFAIVELEDRSTVDIPKKIIPKEAREGDVLIVKIDTDETSKREERIKNLMNDLFE